MHWINICVLLLSLISGGYCWFATHHESEACQVWDNVTWYAQEQPDIHTSCRKMAACNGFECNGTYTYSGFYAVGSVVKVDFCYGMEILECSRPVGLFFYIAFPDKPDFEETVYNSTILQLKGIHYGLGSLGQADGFIKVEMEEKRIYRKKYVQLGMRFLMRVQAAGGYYETWPQGFQRTLMPDTLVPVLPCYKDMQSYMTAPTALEYKCGKYSMPTVTTLPPGISTVPHAKPDGPSKKCSPNKLGNCDNNQLCDKNQCFCLPDTIWNKDTHACVGKSTTAVPIIDFHDIVEPGRPEHKPLSTGVIIGLGCVGVVAIIAVILVVFIVRYKRHQARYGQHELLLNNEDDPADEST